MASWTSVRMRTLDIRLFSVREGRYSVRARKVGTRFFYRSKYHGGDPHCGSALNSRAIVGTFHADRSWPGGLALCCRAGSLRLCHDLCCRRALVWAPLDGRDAVGLAVRGAVRVLDLLPAP